MKPIITRDQILAWLLILVLVGLASCSPAGDAAELNEAEIYATVIREQYGPDDTFGGTLQAPNVYLVRTTDDNVGDPDAPEAPAQTLSPELQQEISAALSDLPAKITWVDSRDEVPLDPDTGAVAGNGVIIQVGNIHEGEDGALLVSSSIYVAGLAAGGQTYILEQVDGAWTVTGNTGVQWIS